MSNSSTTWTREQSIIVALWVLAHQGDVPAEFAAAIPPTLLAAINAVGPSRFTGGVIYHMMGYQRLFFDRPISVTVTHLQRDIAAAMFSEGIAPQPKV